jgi:hypothetical protein
MSKQSAGRCRSLIVRADEFLRGQHNSRSPHAVICKPFQHLNEQCFGKEPCGIRPGFD